ncbi:hypothetical protein B0J11DRAFT_347731 [Dendryphion nanum]|uniref:Uncharacterized protein n=1 Tax=Dendryphion nanum TaxID=256645 RepID=A0A9P9DQL4_9PLEO|nr:hypothetical protein B0J11DRAFT_347731 [Dendryphion nanum]
MHAFIDQKTQLSNQPTNQILQISSKPIQNTKTRKHNSKETPHLPSIPRTKKHQDLCILDTHISTPKPQSPNTPTQPLPSCAPALQSTQYSPIHPTTSPVSPISNPTVLLSHILTPTISRRHSQPHPHAHHKTPNYPPTLKPSFNDKIHHYLPILPNPPTQANKVTTYHPWIQIDNRKPSCTRSKSEQVFSTKTKYLSQHRRFLCILYTHLSHTAL